MPADTESITLSQVIHQVKLPNTQLWDFVIAASVMISFVYGIPLAWLMFAGLCLLKDICLTSRRTTGTAKEAADFALTLFILGGANPDNAAPLVRL